MAVVRMMIKKEDRPSEEQIRGIKESRPDEIIFDEDSPQLTDEMLSKFKRVNPKKQSVRV